MSVTSLNRVFPCSPRETLIRNVQITCLYDMDIPRPENFNETYLYEGRVVPRYLIHSIERKQSLWSVILLPS